MTNHHIETLTEIIHNRQSLYPAQFTGDIIDDDAINWILANAIQAPSHRQVNPWRFTVIKQDNIQLVVDYFESTYKKHIALDKYNQAKLDGFAKKLRVTSHFLIITMQENHERPVPEWENIAAVSSAVQNIYLSITAAGLGGYWSSPSLMIKHIEELIPLKEDEKCLGFFYIGQPKKDRPPKPNKGELKDYVRWL